MDSVHNMPKPNIGESIRVLIAGDDPFTAQEMSSRIQYANPGWDVRDVYLSSDETTNSAGSFLPDIICIMTILRGLMQHI